MDLDRPPPDGNHQSMDGQSVDTLEQYCVAMDHRQGRSRYRPPSSVAMRTRGPVAIVVEREAIASDREMAAFGTQRPFDPLVGAGPAMSRSSRALRRGAGRRPCCEVRQEPGKGQEDGNRPRPTASLAPDLDGLPMRVLCRFSSSVFVSKTRPARRFATGQGRSRAVVPGPNALAPADAGREEFAATGAQAAVPRFSCPPNDRFCFCGAGFSWTTRRTNRALQSGERW